MRYTIAQLYGFKKNCEFEIAYIEDSLNIKKYTVSFKPPINIGSKTRAELKSHKDKLLGYIKEIDVEIKRLRENRKNKK